MSIWGRIEHTVSSVSNWVKNDYFTNNHKIIEKSIGTGSAKGAIVGGVTGSVLGEGVGAIPGAIGGAVLGTAGGLVNGLVRYAGGVILHGGGR